MAALALSRRARGLNIAVASVAALGAATLVWSASIRQRVTLAVQEITAAGAIDPDLDVRAATSIISKLGDGLFVRRAVSSDFDPEREIGDVFAVIGALLKGAVKFDAADSTPETAP